MDIKTVRCKKIQLAMDTKYMKSRKWLPAAVIHELLLTE